MIAVLYVIVISIVSFGFAWDRAIQTINPGIFGIVFGVSGLMGFALVPLIKDIVKDQK